MLIKFTTGGRGGGGTVADYLTDPKREGREEAPPEVVRGDMDLTRALIDGIDRQWSYTHGVLAFAPEDAPTEAQQIEAMDLFEGLAFAGLDADQYDITWVRHSHTQNGRVELHFVTPRMELASGKALNIAPPGWENTYRPLRDTLNWSYGWARPDDPARAQELSVAPERSLEGFSLREGREALHDYVTALVASGQIIDRVSMVDTLVGAGLEVPRQGKDYLTVLDPETGERCRLKGRIYEKDWTREQELDRAAAREAAGADLRDRGIDPERAGAARLEYESRLQSRAEWHRERYPRDAADDTREAHRDRAAERGDAFERDAEIGRDAAYAALDSSELSGNDWSLLGDLIDRDLVVSGGADRDPAGLEPGEGGFGEIATNDGAGGHQNDRGQHLCDLAEEDFDGGDLHMRGSSVSETATRKQGVRHGGTLDRARERALETVREIGERLGSGAELLQAAGARLTDALETFWGEVRSFGGSLQLDQQAADAIGRSLERAEQQNAELDRASEQALENQRELEQTQQEHQRSQDRGFGFER